MPQNRETGAEADRWGRETARKIILLLHGKPISKFSNECKIRGQRLVVKCARPTTQKVGVSYQMLERIDAVIGAFARDHRMFDLFLLTASQYKVHMTPTRSRGASSGHVGMVRKLIFEQLGKSKGLVDILD
jgi:hypothetical protein